MTLNNLERRNSPHFTFFSRNSIALLANYVTVVEDRRRPIMSVKYCLLAVLIFHFWPLLIHPASRSLCDSLAIVITYKGPSSFSEK